MKCENCGSELVGAAIVCRQCNHNNAQGRVSQWRARRTGDLHEPATRTISPLANVAPSEIPKPRVSASRPLEPRRSSSIPFEPKIQINHISSPTPSSSKISSSAALPSPPLAAENNAGEDQTPPWRAQLKERVKQARERVTTGPLTTKTEPDEAELDPNPIVEAALKRIRWASHAPSAISAPRVARNRSQAAALAEEPQYDIPPQPEIEARSATELKLEPKPTAIVKPTPTNPLLARSPNTQPVNQPENRPLPPRPPAAPKPEPTPKIAAPAEARIELKPAPKPEAQPIVESKPAGLKPRVTGDLKLPLASSAPAPLVVQQQPGNSGPLTPPRKTVETKIIEIPQSSTATLAVKTKPAAKQQSVTIWVRTLAGACDFEIIATAYLPLFAFYATLNTSLGRDSLTIMFFLLATLTFCYQLLTLTLADRTSGMAMLNLRLVNVAGSGKPIVFTQKFARAVAATAAFLLPPLNLIVMQSNQQRHTLPDLLSGTTLVEK